MRICPVEGTVQFSECHVATCMWHKPAGNGCSHTEDSATTEEQSTASPVWTDETFAVRARVMQYIMVGTFLEEASGRDLASMTAKDFVRTQDEFTAWCKRKSVKGYKEIVLADVIKHIMNAL